MKLVVLGATGGTGLEIVRRGIQQGQSVTAFVRSPERLKPFRDKITIKQGDLLNSAELEKVIRGHDAVVSGFGPRVPISKADANLLQQFAIALTRAMPHAGVRRVVVESVAFLFKDSIVPPAYLLGSLFFRSCDHRDLQTRPTGASIACARVTCLVSASRFRARMWPTSWSRRSQIVPRFTRSSVSATNRK